MPMVDPILITGVPRSGTSLVANIVNQAGARGGVLDVNGTKENPTGFYENQEIITKVTKRILFDLGYDPRGQVKLPGTDCGRVDVSNEVFDIVRGQGIGTGEKWFFKDPKTILLYGSWNESFPKAKWVLVRRNTTDIVGSCLRTNFMGDRETIGEWIEYAREYMNLMDALRYEGADARELWYDNIIEGNYEELREVIEWLGLKYDERYIDEITIR